MVSSLPIGRGSAKITEKDKQTLTVRSNTVYYLAKNKCLYSEFRNLLLLQVKNGVKTSDMYHNERAGANFIDTIGTSIRQKLLEDIEKCNYFTLLMDGSTDSSFTEQELIYVLFLDSKGTPSVEFLSIENIKYVHAYGLKGSIVQAFERLKLMNWKKNKFFVIVLKDYLSSRNLEAYLQKLSNNHQNQQGHVGLHKKSRQWKQFLLIMAFLWLILSLCLKHIHKL